MTADFARLGVGVALVEIRQESLRPLWRNVMQARPVRQDHLKLMPVTVLRLDALLVDIPRRMHAPLPQPGLRINEVPGVVVHVFRDRRLLVRRALKVIQQADRADHGLIEEEVAAPGRPLRGADVAMAEAVGDPGRVHRLALRETPVADALDAVIPPARAVHRSQIQRRHPHRRLHNPVAVGPVLDDRAYAGAHHLGASLLSHRYPSLSGSFKPTSL